MAHLVDELGLPEFDFFAWDARGHGRSPGARGDSARASPTSVRDVQTSSTTSPRSTASRSRTSPWSRRASARCWRPTWVHDYAPRIRCVVLASPAFKVKLYVPFARAGLALMQKLRGNFFVNSYVKAKFLTHDPERIASYDTDPLISRADLGRHPARALRDRRPHRRRRAGDHRADAAADLGRRLGRPSRAAARASSTGSGAPVKEKHVLPGFFHDTLGERDRAPAVEHIRVVRAAALRRAAAPPT